MQDMFKSGCCRKQFKSTIKLLYIEFCDAHLWIMSVIRTTERIVEHRRKQQQIVGIIFRSQMWWLQQQQQENHIL